MHDAHPTAAPRRRPGGFTLIEILVVVGIIALLIGISYPAIRGFIESSETYLAQSILTGFASASEEYNIVTQSIVLPQGDDANPFGGANLDVDFTNSDANNTMGWFIFTAGSIDTVDSLIRIAGKNNLTFNERPVSSVAQDIVAPIVAAAPGGTPTAAQMRAIVVLDPWQTPIRYAGGTLRTGASDPTDDDDYLPTHPTAFFASAGPDGLWGEVDENNQPDPSIDVNEDGEPDAEDNIYSFEID